MRLPKIAALALLVGLVSVSSAMALKISGTNGPDVLRGTTNADRISGGNGNDRLYGLDGNDVLVGGAGRDLLAGGPGDDRLTDRDGARDVFTCGHGRDTVTGDQLDKAAADCEVVLRKRTQPPWSPPDPPVADLPPSPPQPSPPPSPPVTAVTSGSYRGATSVGNYVFFDVTPNRTVRGFRVNDFRLVCDGALTLYGPLDVGANYEVPIDSTGRFRIEYAGGGTASDGTPYKYDIRVAGLVQGVGASGTAYLWNEVTYDGRVYRCATEQQTWSAARLP
jgi:hypothetical protein